MKLSAVNIKHLGSAVTGEGGYTHYKSGPELVDLFNRFGADDEYGTGFPSRWKYAEENLKRLNDSEYLQSVVESLVDPRGYIGSEMRIDNVVERLNEFLVYDGYKVVKYGTFFKVAIITAGLVQPTTITEINHEFIQEQINKCFTKVDQGDYSGAITNARTLAEAVMIEVVESDSTTSVKYDGNIEKLYKQVKKNLKLNPDPQAHPETVVQILSGLNSITSGLAGLSNGFADRHANKNKPSIHHAKLAINSVMTLCDFLIDSMEYQKMKRKTE